VGRSLGPHLAGFRVKTGTEEDQAAPMTTSPLDRDRLRAALEAAGWRWTPQRGGVYEYLCRAADHPTAEEVYQGVKATIPSISLATVYKALEALVASRLATKLTAGDASARYDARSDPHYHLRCLRSGTVEDLATRFDPDLIAKLDPELTQDLERKGFRVTGYRLELVGYFDPPPPSSPGSSGG
jgi:Fur family transcriptional regulator, peroxide stress response regulator